MTVKSAGVAKLSVGSMPDFPALKAAKMKQSAFAFFRGSAAVHYKFWAAHRVPAAPLSWICGDAHLENIGCYKSDNRISYFDLNDFDEATMAPLTWEIGRAITGLLILGKKPLAWHFLDSYRLRLMTGKAEHIEPEVAEGIVAALMSKVAGRTQKAFLAARVKDNAIQVRAGKTYRLIPELERHVRKVFSTWASSQRDPQFYAVHDVCGRIAGTGSLGVERFEILVRGDKHARILDMKEARQSATVGYWQGRQPIWQSEAERVATVQNFMQYQPIALLSWTRSSPKSYIIRELQPLADRVDLTTLQAKQYSDLIGHWADLIASAQLRSAGWRGSAILDDLIQFGQRFEKRQQRALVQSAQSCADFLLRLYSEFRSKA